LGLAHWISLWLLQAAFADTVAVESEPRASELDQVLLDGCNGALGAARCSLSGATIGAAPTWIARVRWEADARRARVEFRRGDGGSEPAEVRDVEFAPADNDAQRRRAVGLIIAAFVIEQAEARAAQEASVQPVPERTSDPANASTTAPGAGAAGSEPDAGSAPDTVIEIAPDLVPPPRPPEWAIDVAVLAGPGFERGAPRVGVMLRGLLWPLSLPVAGSTSLRVAQRFDEPTVRWLSATLGVAWQLVPQWSAVGLELRGEAALQHVWVAADEPAGGDDSESGHAWRAGALVGAGAWLQLGARTALLAGFELSLLRPRVYLDIGGSAAGLDPALTWAGTLGVRMAH
jgi:hypothetical protein